jgi:trimeric autotransporter adhesin
MTHIFNGTERVQVSNSTTDNVGIGTTSPTHALNVTPLSELSEFITTNKHLPGLPGAKLVGQVEAGEINNLLLQKIEEQAIYIIQLKEESESKDKELNAKIQALQTEIQQIKQS